jgi:hypothetical protein
MQKSLNDITSCTGQYLDIETITVSSVDMVPSKGPVWFAIRCTGAAGNVVLDAYGQGGTGGSTTYTYAIAAGETLQLAVTKVHHTSTSATGLVGLY